MAPAQSTARYIPQLRTALVLTGTGTAGAYHAGALRALSEAGVKIDLIAGRGVGVYVWPVNTEAELERVLGAGATGINSDNLDLLAEVVASAGAPPAPASGT